MLSLFAINHSFFLFLSFFFFSIMIISSVLVIYTENTVYSVLYLVLVFFNAGMLLLLFDAEFLAFIVLIIYVGAIAVLFLFVVMMLNVKLLEVQSRFYQYLPLASFLGIVLFIELFVTTRSFLFPTTIPFNSLPVFVNWIDLITTPSNVQLIGYIIFTFKYTALLLSGFILLIAMLGSIVLTIDNKSNVRRQDIRDQLNIPYTYGNLMRGFLKNENRR